MAIREFTDSRRVEWRVWDVSPSVMHPVTRAEDFMTLLQHGWLAFESAREKRRLEAPYPPDWVSYDIPALEALCREAKPVFTRRAKSASGQQLAITAAEIEREAEEGEDSRRKFMSPQGREWTVRVHECLDRDGATQRVLRFTAGDIVVELLTWPENWRDLSVLEYAVLLLDAEPPRRRPKGQGPQRRSEDHVVEGKPSVSS